MCLDLDQHISALNLHRIHRQLRPRRPSLARLRIPFPPMPRTDNLPSRDDALPKRSSAMQADVIHGADFAVNVGDADGLVAAREFFGFVGSRKVGLRGEFGEHSSWQLALSTSPLPSTLRRFLIQKRF